MNDKNEHGLSETMISGNYTMDDQKQILDYQIECLRQARRDLVGPSHQLTGTAGKEPPFAIRQSNDVVRSVIRDAEAAMARIMDIKAEMTERD